MTTVNFVHFDILAKHTLTYIIRPYKRKGANTMNTLSFDEALKTCMIETGRAGEKDRIKVTGREPIYTGSDKYNVFVELYKPRSRKPDMLWSVCVDCVRELIYWDHSEYYKVK